MRNTDRIGSASLNTNQNIAGTLARLGFDEHQRFLPWVLACFLVLALTVWAARRALRAGEPVLAVICIALFGLAVSPVSWSHHWVWMLEAVLVTAVLAWRRRNVVMAVVSAGGVALMGVDPDPSDAQAPRGDCAAGGVSSPACPILWWALATLVAAGASISVGAATAPAPRPSTAPAPVSAVS